ncbi:MAG: GNAT family N-acetyltransferase [Spirochaetaceae bacterium]|jgi:ribosomal protein S18 acetylase RimI-like enzyme|nr:GNAT family N-acetyltransferase [Spirochaetaceae bacterium]
MIHRYENRWRSIGKNAATLPVLRSREAYCVAAMDRLFSGVCDNAWALQDHAGNSLAVLLSSKGTLFPVFNGRPDIPMPRFMGGFLKKNAIHAVQGLRPEVETLETGLRPLGASSVEKIDYDLMALDRHPNPHTLRRGPGKLILRRPGPNDTEALFLLQAAYEQEEVLPAGAEFYPAACRLSVEHIITRERALIAELEGRILGKINTNAASLSRYQIGGVYVLPEYRGLGIATRLTAAFAKEIIAEGKLVTLFVKKQNLPARSVYRRIGFISIGDYRISYY